MDELSRPKDTAYLPGAGTLIGGKYRIEGTIGEGGMAVVLLATHEGLRQKVAVKVLQPKFAASRELRERFFREARALAALSSEHITRVFDVGTLESGAAYLVLEHLEGMDLHAVLQKEGPLSWRRAVGYLIQASKGLKDAHDHKILHRDIKPANMFLMPVANTPGKIKLLDFGLAKLKEEGGGVSSLTGAESVMGSPSYMSPEQIKGLTNADERSDIWSLGVSLYELLCDGYPFEADTAMKIAAAVIVEKPKPLSARVKNLPPGLEDVIMSCLVKDPEARTRSASQLITQLTPFATLEGYDEPPPDRPVRRLQPKPLPNSAMPWRSREAEPTYGGMMESATATPDDGKETLVAAPRPSKSETPEPEDEDEDRRAAAETLVQLPTGSTRSETEPPPPSVARHKRAGAYDPDGTMRDARSKYFELNKFPADGGYDDAWVDFKLGPIPFPFPNTSSRKRAVRVHDLHHIVTGYNTDLIGEFEISAWEIGAGCRDFIAAWQLNLGGMAGGLLFAPRRTFRAFVRGRHSESLYGRDVETMLSETVATARMMMGVDEAATARASGLDVVLFVVAELAGIVIAILFMAFGLVLAPIGLLIAAFRKRK